MFEITFRMGRTPKRQDAKAMGDWIDDGWQRERRNHNEEYLSHAIRLDKVDRLKLVCPDWMEAFCAEVERLTEKLKRVFRDEPRYHYSYERTPTGCVVTCDGPRYTSTEIEFVSEIQRVNVRNSEKRAKRGTPADAGILTVSEDSRVIVTYSARIFRDGVPTTRERTYTDAVEFANDIMREITHL
jgi:hypothetical protein